MKSGGYLKTQGALSLHEASSSVSGQNMMVWRPAWEIRSAFVWLIAALFALLWQVALNSLAPMPLLLTVFCIVLAQHRFLQACALWRTRAPLSGRAPQMMGEGDICERLREMTKKSSALSAPFLGARAPYWQREGRYVSGIWFGEGFRWTPLHAQRLFELSARDVRTLLLPERLRRFLGYDPGLSERDVGVPYIHGVQAREYSIVRPLKSLGGGTLLVGTTQAGKGVMLTNLVTQAVLRGDVVIVIDPKSSKRLRNALWAACRAAGRRAPLEFHPAFPDRGVRLDPLGSFSRPSELASRIQAVMPGDTAGAFGAFAWSAVNVAVGAMLFNDERPSLCALSRIIGSGVDDILARSLERHFNRTRSGVWREEVANLVRELSTKEGRSRYGTLQGAPALNAKIRYYEESVAKKCPSPVIEEQIQVFRHNREHYAKITASLQPILSMLTAGTLGKSLSPDFSDSDDERPVMTFEKVVNGHHVFYLGLDALPDATVASALGSLMLADLTALAGKRYNLQESGDEASPISLFVDESSNVMNQPLIELLNKGMEAGIQVTLAMQTVADLAVRLGSDTKARMALGNLNNLIALRTKDQQTQAFVCETFGKTTLWQTDASISSGAGGSLLPLFNASVMRRLSGSREELVSPDMLGKLPNFEFFASLSGGRLYKGRIPILNPEESGCLLLRAHDKRQVVR